MKEKNSSNPSRAGQSLKDSFRMTPPADGWSRLDAELEKKQAGMYRQKANRFKWLSILLALLLLSFVSYYYLIPSRSPSHQTASSVVSKQNNAALLNQPTVNGVANSESHNNSSTLASLKNNTKAPKGAGDGYVKQATLGNYQKQQPFVKNPSDKIISRPAISLRPDAPANTRLSALKKTNGLVAYSKPAGVESPGINDKVSEKNNNPSQAGTNTPAKVEESYDNTVNTPSQNGAFSSDNESNKPTIEEKKSSVSKDPNTLPDLATKGVPTDTTNTVPLSQNKGNLSRWSLSLFFSPHYIKNHLKNNTTSGVDYSSKYLDREKPMFSYASGLLIRYNLTGHWSISTGGVYSTIAYSINVPAIHARTDANNDVHYYYPTSCGVIEMPDNYGGIPVHQGDSMLNAGCTQVIKFINVPVLIRYEMKKNRFTLFGEGGASANFVLQEQAKVTVANSETTVTNNIYGLQNMNYGFLVGAGAEYNIFSGIGVFVEPVFKGSLNSLTKNTVVNCYPYSFGANAGVSLHF